MRCGFGRGPTLAKVTLLRRRAALLAWRGPFMLVCYLRHGDRVFEPYWTSGRGDEVMAPSYGGRGLCFRLCGAMNTVMVSCGAAVPRVLPV